MAISQIANQLRGLGQKTFVLIAEALEEIEKILIAIPALVGLTADSKGIQKINMLAQRFKIIGTNGTTVMAQIFAENNAAIFELDAVRTLSVRDILLRMHVDISAGNISINSGLPGTVETFNVFGDLATNGDFTQTLTAKGGVTAGPLAILFVDATKNYLDHLMTFVDAVDGNATHQIHLDVGGLLIEVKKGPDNVITQSVDTINVTFVVKNISADTTIKPESVATPRLGVGAAPPTTDGHAVIGVFLGVIATAPSAGEAARIGGDARIDGNLGVGMDPTIPLDVTGDAHITGALEVDSAATFNSTVTLTPLSGGDVLVAQSGGTLTTIAPATARFALDVYSKAEVDAAIAAAIAAIVVDNALVGTPEEHSHSLS